MKIIHIASLILIFNALFGQVDYTLSIEKIHYGFGEYIPIIVTATNTQDTIVTLSWSDHCQAAYAVDSVWYNYDCIQIPSEITLPPDSSFSWNFIYEGTDSISSGVHFIQGEVIDYGNTDSLFIHVSDIDTAEVLSYLPLQIGNRWQFLATQGHIGNQDDTLFITITIDTMVMIEGLNYYHFDPFFMTDIPSFYDPLFEYIRIDTNELVVKAPDAQWGQNDVCGERSLIPLYLDETIDISLYRNFSVFLEECIPSYLEFNPNFYFSQLDTTLQTITATMLFNSTIYLIPEIGLGQIERFYHWNSAGFMYLIAAEINGITYGEFLGINDKISIPKQYSLANPYPNPFNPVINIDFTVPYLSKVSIRIIDVMGREIEVLVDEYKSPESYTMQWNAHYLPSGVYFIQMQAGKYVQIRKMVLLK